MITAHFDKILVVDDSTVNIELLTKLLTAQGYTVHTASDGELALEFVRSTLPDLVLLDIRMPGMDGYEVCRRLKADERTRAIPVIFITILEDERLLQEIGRRIEDALTGSLIHRNLREGEERYRMVFQNSPVSIWEEDFSAVKNLFDDLKKQRVADIEAWIDRHPEMVRLCSESVKILDVNQAAVALCGAANKETLFDGLVQLFTPETFDTFRRELVCLWNGGVRGHWHRFGQCTPHHRPARWPGLGRR
jgi:CheY-like chemotaxis protein